MAGGVGSLTVSLGLDAVDFTDGLTKAQQQAQQFAGQVKAIAIGTALGEAITGFTTKAVSGFYNMTVGAIDAADHLNDLSKKTGVAVDVLGGIGFAAGQAGGTLETASAAAGKLNKTLAEAAAGNKDAAEFFNVLGLSAKDASGATKSADVALVEIANKFAGYADGPEKAAIALRGFGKAGADIIPLLNDGGKALRENIEYFKRYSGVTQDVANASDQFNDALGKVNLLSGALGTTVAAALLPSLQGIADAFLRMKETGAGFTGIADGVKTIFDGLVVAGANVAFVFLGVGREIGAIGAQLNALAHGDIKGFSAIGDAVKEDGVRARKELDDFTAAYRKTAADPSYYSNEGRNSAAAPKPSAPRFPARGAGDDAASTLKKQLDGQIKLIQDFTKQQGQAYAFGNQYIEGVYQDGITSQREFFADQKSLRDAALANQIAGFNAEIAALQRFANDPAAKPADRVAAEEKIKLAVQQRTQAVTKASQDDILATQANARAVAQLDDAYVSLTATILNNAGDTFGAQALKNAQQVSDAARLLKAAGRDQGQADQLAAQLNIQNQAAQQQKEYQKLLDDTSRKEAEIYADAKINGKGELETLAAIRDARQAAIVQLQQQADAAAVLAQQPGANADDAKRSADLALAVKKAQAEIDPLKDKFNGIFEDSFANSFAGFITGAQTASQAFKSFANSVIAELARIASQQLAQAIFSGSSGSSGGSSFLGLIGTAFSLYSGSYNENYGNEGRGYKLATGTNYVPYDGMQATLHRGEAVVPAKYNPANGASNQGGGITVVNHLSVPIGKVTESRLSKGERMLLLEEATDRAVAQVTAQHYDPNSKIGKAMKQNYSSERKR